MRTTYCIVYCLPSGDTPDNKTDSVGKDSLRGVGQVLLMRIVEKSLQGFIH